MRLSKSSIGLSTQVGAKQLSPQLLLPVVDEMAGEVDRRSSGKFIGIGVRHCWDRRANCECSCVLIGTTGSHDRIRRTAVSRVDHTAMIVRTPSATRMSETGQVSPVRATVAVAMAITGVRPPPMAAPTWNPSGTPLDAPLP
jgi:hypothetical protein